MPSVSDRLITPEVLKGFRDYLPEQMLARERMIDIARTVYRRFGFSPIETPTLEYAKILLGKGGEESDKQLFRFTDQGDRDVAMRFDLTVPLARFAAQHFHEVGLPFKRYHIATVWRAEKPQKGRFREFMQCDFDTIGTESNAADIETFLVIHDLLVALGFEKFRIRINNRRILNGLLQQIGLEGQTAGILRALDKLAKIGPAAVTAEMVDKVGATPEQAEQVLEMTRPDISLAELETRLANNETGASGVARVRELFSVAHQAGISPDRMQLDVSIARGLDYYTGTIFETFLDELPGIGSICSGGRYDNLAELFTKERLPGVGASLGLDRLLAAMEELKLLENQPSPVGVFIPFFDASRLADYQRIARLLRAEGLGVEVYPEPKALGKQLKYADKKRIPLALIAGGDEFATGIWQLKDLRTGTSQKFLEAEVTAAIKAIL